MHWPILFWLIGGSLHFQGYQSKKQKWNATMHCQLRRKTNFVSWHLHSKYSWYALVCPSFLRLCVINDICWAGLSPACGECWGTQIKCQVDRSNNALMASEATCLLNDVLCSCPLPCFLDLRGPTCTECLKRNCYPACSACSGMPVWSFPAWCFVFAQG